MERTKPDFSPFEFSQRFTGTFTADGKRIDGTWEIADDHKTWRKDFVGGGGKSPRKRQLVVAREREPVCGEEGGNA